jgi:cytochrome c-type biogenesis protein CcmH/NrfF
MVQAPPAPALLAVALYGLPLAFILLMVVLVLNFRERRRSR